MAEYHTPQPIIKLKISQMKRFGEAHLASATIPWLAVPANALKAARRFSLSPRERAGVRGKESSNYPRSHSDFFHRLSWKKVVSFFFFFWLFLTPTFAAP